jgi:hypothetical protein
VAFIDAKTMPKGNSNLADFPSFNHFGGEGNTQKNPRRPQLACGKCVASPRRAEA